MCWGKDSGRGWRDGWGSGRAQARRRTPRRAQARWTGGAPFYDTYRTADGRYMAVGALERKFYAELLARLGLDAAELPDQYDRSGWPLLRERLAAAFGARTQAEWTARFEGSDACVAPV